MSLGVLNNLSAMYAENDLNNTSNSLNTVLQQLSSGSKINSGADDAAGLSLVDGLQANSMALAQSQTNASEGVGLLKVADGALSQVTNLLNRAVTLATEASNGTLNTSQDAAANSEYQSILSEINNIGATTTYNNQTVFGTASPVNIYTGDSSTAGASIDALNIGSLSSSNVGDTGGTMAYSNGQNNVFLNLSTGTQNAAVGDQLSSTGTTTLNVNYLVPGTDGNSTTASAPITVSGSQNTVSGLMDAINQSGLGLTATFATQAQAGVQGGGAETGIEISGGLISAGVAPSTASTSGTLNPSGIAANELLTQGQTVGVSMGGNSIASIAIDSNTTNLQQLALAINNAAGNTTGSGPTITHSAYVNATVVTNGDGTQSLSLADSTGSNGALSVSVNTTGAGPIAPAFANGGIGTIATNTTSLQTVNVTNAAGTAYQAAQQGSVTVGLSNMASQMSLSGSITLTNTPTSGGAAVTETFVMGSSAALSGSASTGYTIGVATNTLAALQAAINTQTNAGVGSAGLGITAGAPSGAGAMTLTATGGTVTSNGALTNTNTNTGVAANATETPNADGTLTMALAPVNASTDKIGVGSTITVQDGTNAAVTFTVGSNATDTATSRHLAATNGVITMGALATAISGYMDTLNVNGSASTLTATATSAGLTIASGATGNTGVGILVTGVNLLNTQAPLSLFSPTLHSGTDYATALLGLTDTVGGTIVNPQMGSALTGQLVVSNNGVTDTFVMGAAPDGNYGLDGVANKPGGGNIIYIQGSGSGGAVTMSDLMGAINTPVQTDALHLTASTGGPAGGLYLQDVSEVGTTITFGANNSLAVVQSANQLASTTAYSLNTGSASSVVIGPASASTTLSLGGPTSTIASGLAGHVVNSMTVQSNTDTLTGTLKITPGGATSGTPVNLNLNGQTLAEIQANSAWAAAGITATLTSGNTVLTLTEKAASTVGPTVGLATGSTITDDAAEVNTNDVLTGVITLTNANGGTPLSETFTMGGSANDGTGFGSYTAGTAGTGTFLVNGNTLADLQNAINSQTTAGANSLGLGLVAQAGTAGLTVSTNANNGYLVGVAQTSGGSPTNGTLVDTTEGTKSQISMGTFATQNDAVSGNLTFTIGTNAPTVIQVDTPGETVQGMINQINYGSSTATSGPYVNGVTASWQGPTTGQNFGSILLQSNTQGTLGNITKASETIADAPTAANLTYAAANAYNTGISGSVSDYKTGQSAATFSSDSAAHSGIATISYSHGAGQSLAITDLSNSTDAKASLTALNAAITDVASQDGYIGAQINTLNSVSSVLSTQQQNVTAAQNAVQATDYASAASNMSKYEILSQTGISALAQANSMQQEVTKLLQ